ncbi:hypothetical protein FB451DRAFT_1221262 [Mycena latifolia]|nr:hypothetical protein FB451DRAFT_1221262 [Mycena latifolia]
MMFPDSSFADKLNTNYVPSHREMAQLLDLLAEPMNELARLDTQLNEMEASILQLKVTRCALKAAIDAHQALMAPLRRIPQDVLGEIFVACLPTAHNALLDPDEAPLLLGRICRQWRNVAYSTPRIWSSLHIPSGTPPLNWEMTRSVESKLENAVGAWLDRSGACPLSISLTRRSEHHFRTPGSINRVIGASRRLQHLRINGKILDVRPLLLTRGEDLPYLRSIIIDTRGSDEPLTFWDGVPALHAPNLSQISLRAQAEALTLPLLWSQLTDLNLECFIQMVSPHDTRGGLSLNGAQEVLRRCPNLVRCSLRTTNSSVPFVAGPPIALPHLKALVLFQNFDSVKLIQCLEIPALRYLGVGGNGPCRSLRAVERSAHELTLELMYSCYFPNDGPAALLHLLPRLSCIQAPGLGVEETFIDALHPTPKGTLCPALTHIELPNCHFGDSSLLDLIRARMATDCPLKRIKAHFDRTMEVDIVRELGVDITEGLYIKLKYLSGVHWKFDAREGLFREQEEERADASDDEDEGDSGAVCPLF